MATYPLIYFGIANVMSSPLHDYIVFMVSGSPKAWVNLPTIIPQSSLWSHNKHPDVSYEIANSPAQLVFSQVNSVEVTMNCPIDHSMYTATICCYVSDCYKAILSICDSIIFNVPRFGALNLYQPVKTPLGTLQVTCLQY